MDLECQNEALVYCGCAGSKISACISCPMWGAGENGKIRELYKAQNVKMDYESERAFLFDVFDGHFILVDLSSGEQMSYVSFPPNKVMDLVPVVRFTFQSSVSLVSWVQSLHSWGLWILRVGFHEKPI